MLSQAALAALNHILSGEDWARERLRLFGGQRLRLVGGSLKLELQINGEGYFRRLTAATDELPDVIIELPADTPWRLLTDRQSVLAAARLSGKADFTETLAFVFRNLRWDVEDDLSKVLGDIFAHRLVRAGASMLGWHKQLAGNLTANVAEYLGEEAELLVPQREIESFRIEAGKLSEDVARLERRLASLA